MKCFDVPLSVATSGKGTFDAYMTAYIPTNELTYDFYKSRPAVVIFPGGGYNITYTGEAEPIALKFTAQGIAAFVVWYSTVAKCPENPPRFPQALAEGLTAVKYVRDHAAEFGINPHNIATLGFSAGGHLCACTGTLWKHPLLDPYLPGKRADYRPDKLILCYPVITPFGPHHQGSFDCLLGDRQTSEMLELVSLDRQVSKDTPPVFLWHTFSDTGVPVHGSLRFGLALFEHQIPCEMHLFPQGPHALCSGDHTTLAQCAPNQSLYVADWVEHACAFLLNETIQAPMG